MSLCLPASGFRANVVVRARLRVLARTLRAITNGRARLVVHVLNEYCTNIHICIELDYKSLPARREPDTGRQ